MIPASYTGGGQAEGETSNNQGQGDNFKGDNSAMGLNAMEDYDLSQIMNPNVEIILDDSGFEEKHQNTNETKGFLYKVFFWIEKKIIKQDQTNLAVAFNSIKKLEADCTMGIVNMQGNKR